MARKFKKDQLVIYKNNLHTVVQNQDVFRNRPSVKIIDADKIIELRVSPSELRLAEPRPIDEKTTLTELIGDHGVVNIELVPNETNGASQYENTETSEPVSNKYEKQIINKVGESIRVDVYDVLDAFNVTDAATAHAVKKLLMPGLRGGKDIITDLKEAIASVERAIDRQHMKSVKG